MRQCIKILAIFLLLLAILSENSLSQASLTSIQLTPFPSPSPTTSVSGRIAINIPDIVAFFAAIVGPIVAFFILRYKQKKLILDCLRRELTNPASQCVYWIKTIVKEVISDPETRRNLSFVLNSETYQMRNRQSDDIENRKTVERLIEALTEAIKKLSPTNKEEVTVQPTSPVDPTLLLVKGKIDFAIITIREDEFEAVLERFAPEPQYLGDRRYVIGRVDLEGDDYYQVAIARSTDQGEGPAQDLARDMIEQLAPEWLLVIGIAGGVPEDDFTLGDVVVAKRLLDFSVKAISEDKPPEYDIRGWAHPLVERICAALPSMRNKLDGKWNSPKSMGVLRPGVQLDQEDRFYGDDAWKLKVKTSLEKHFRAPRSPRFTTAVIAAAEELVKSPTLVQFWLQDARSMRAVEMELAGVYQAARRAEHQYPVLAIRGISDIVGFKRDSYWTDYACHAAAAFAYILVRSGFIKPSRASQTGIFAE